MGAPPVPAPPCALPPRREPAAPRCSLAAVPAWLLTGLMTPGWLGCAPASRAPTPPPAVHAAPLASTAAGATGGRISPGAAAPSSGGREEYAEPTALEIQDDADSLPVMERLGAHPLDGWTEGAIREALARDPEALGSMSFGRPNGGALRNAVPMPPGAGWELVDPDHAWGTQETVDGLVRAIGEVQRVFPKGTRPVRIGHISARAGGPLRPHASHQAGRDADIGYYYTQQKAWFARATPKNLDPGRTWVLVRALITETDVELILIDASLQKALRAYALALGEDPVWLANVFDGLGSPRGPLIRHAPGHATHLHVRFFSPMSRESARRVLPVLVADGTMKPPTVTVQHRVKQGETLGKLAKRYDTSVKAIQLANGLRTTVIVQKKVYRIPTGKGVPVEPAPIGVPPRRMPPGPLPPLPAADLAAAAE